jgi:hypothetical protein
VAAPIALIVAQAVQAYQQHTSEQDFLRWQADVSQSLHEIDQKLAAIAAAIQQLQESFNLLPGKIDDLLQSVKVGEIKGWTEAALQQVEAIRVLGPKYSPNLVGPLWTLASNLGAHEAALEATWGYSAYGVCTLSFLARVAIYRTVYWKDRPSAESAFLVAKRRKIEWLTAGVADGPDFMGPGRHLADRKAYKTEADSTFDALEGGRGFRIGWIEYNSSGNGWTATGEAQNKHVKISQPRVVGSRGSSFECPDTWEKDGGLLNGPTPNWGSYVDIPWSPARRLWPTYQGNLKTIGYDARNAILAALSRNVARYKVTLSSIAVLSPIVEDLAAIREQIEKLTIN